MRLALPLALCAVVLFCAACRRPPEDAPNPEWARSPGLDPHPAESTLRGKLPQALPRVSFRLDPRRSLAEASEGRGYSDTEAEAEFREAADRGELRAQVKLGEIYVRQTADIVKLGEGLRLLSEAAKKDDAEALRILSGLAAEGRGIPQSDKEAYKLMRRAADLGSPEAQFALANMLAAGRGMPRDTGAALVWAREAAKRGFAPAQLAVGRELLASVENNRRKEGFTILQNAAEAGNGQAALFLSSAMVRGQFGLTKDDLRAEALLLPSAQKGDADCQLALAALYQSSEVLSYRRPEVSTWLKRAGQGGNAKAIQMLRLSPDYGGIPEEEMGYVEAASRGEAEAQRKLGQIYVARTDDDEMVTRGRALLGKAAAQNDAEAIRILAEIKAAERAPEETDNRAR